MDGLLAAANWLGSALCHQWDSHSFVINGVPLCLCARCTGMYVGALLALVYLVVRTKGLVGMPRPIYLFAFMVFFGVWAGDGVNSYATTLRGAPFLYMPQNWIRLATGILMGIGLGTLVFVILNLILQPIPRGTIIPPVYARARDFLFLVALGLVLVPVIAAQWDWLLYPLTAVLLVSMVVINTAFWLGITSSLSMRPYLRPVLVRNVLISFALAMLLVNAMALGRTFLNLPVEPPI